MVLLSHCSLNTMFLEQKVKTEVSLKNVLKDESVLSLPENIAKTFLDSINKDKEKEEILRKLKIKKEESEYRWERSDKGEEELEKIYQEFIKENNLIKEEDQTRVGIHSGVGFM